jgi:hypothetical protein
MRVLAQIQRLLAEIYDLDVTHDVRDFLVTDRRRLPAAARANAAHQDEELLVAQDEDELVLSLYLDARVLARLARRDPLRQLDARNVADWWTVLEGVSHFVYLTHNARFDRPVDLLALELQAEVDKYVASLWLLRSQAPERLPLELHPLLFERTHIDRVRAGGRFNLYAAASRHAGAFCRRFERGLARAREAAARPFVTDQLRELRRFYRQGSAQKMLTCAV